MVIDAGPEVSIFWLQKHSWKQQARWVVGCGLAEGLPVYCSILLKGAIVSAPGIHLLKIKYCFD